MNTRQVFRSSAACLAFAALASTLLVAGDAFAGDVFIKAEGAEGGVGLGRLYRGSCYIVTPRHVAMQTEPGEDGWFPRKDLRVVAPDRREAPATVRDHRSDADLAVLLVDTDQPSTFCPATRWPLDHEVKATLDGAKAADGVLKVRRQSGSLDPMPVRLERIRLDDILFAPARPGDQVQQTMSGSALAVDGLVVGMLLGTRGEQSRALSLDTVNLLTRKVFRGEILDTALRERYRQLTGEEDAELTATERAARWSAFVDEFGGRPGLAAEDAELLEDAQMRLGIWRKIATGAPEDEVVLAEATYFLKLLDDSRHDAAYARTTPRFRDLEPSHQFRSRVLAYVRARTPESQPRTCMARPRPAFNAFAASPEGERTVFCVYHGTGATYIEDLALERQPGGRWRISVYFVNAGEVFP